MVALALPACGDGGGDPRDILDGEPRVPDDEGIATRLDFERITLDDRRTYGVSEHLLAFSTYTLQLEPMLTRRAQYVQIGLDGGTMVWMAGIGAVLPAGDRLSAYYNGVLTGVEGGRVTFEDGTVLRIGDGVEIPERGSLVQAQIDARAHEVVSFVVRAEPLPTTTAPAAATTATTTTTTEGPS